MRQASAEVGMSRVLSYWTVEKFEAQLELMRGAYSSFRRAGAWDAQSDPLGDPWHEPDLCQIMRRFADQARGPRGQRSPLSEKSRPSRPQAGQASNVEPAAAAPGRRRGSMLQDGGSKGAREAAALRERLSGHAGPSRSPPAKVQ